MLLPNCFMSTSVPSRASMCMLRCPRRQACLVDPGSRKGLRTLVRETARVLYVYLHPDPDLRRAPLDNEMDTLFKGLPPLPLRLPERSHLIDVQLVYPLSGVIVRPCARVRAQHDTWTRCTHGLV